MVSVNGGGDSLLGPTGDCRYNLVLYGYSGRNGGACACGRGSGCGGSGHGT